MEKSEPTFVPEWLKGNGGLVSYSLHSDDHLAAKTSRNKSLTDINSNRIGASFVSDRTTSSYLRRSPSNNGSSHSRSYGNFGRNNRDRDWEKETISIREKEKHLLSDHRREYSDPLSNILPNRFDKDLRRSQSMITPRLSNTLHRKMPISPSNRNKISGLSNVHKASFERDFPSLGSEEREASEMRRVSALAEVPALAANNKFDLIQKINTSVSVSTAPSMTGLNMAKIVAQGSSRAQTSPQLSGGTQRLEELAIKQSEQLIPVRPTTPKALVLKSSEKQKANIGSSNYSPRIASVTPDILKSSSVGKLQILKPARERNGFLKDNTSPTNINKILANTPIPVGSAPSKTPLEKKLTPQAKSRSDFFKLMRKKSVACSSSTGPGMVSFNSGDSEIANSPDMSYYENSRVLSSSFRDEPSKGSDEKCNESLSERTKSSTFGDEISPLTSSSFGDENFPIMGSSFGDEISLMGSSLGEESSKTLSERTKSSIFGDEISPIKGSSYSLGDEISSITGSSFGNEKFPIMGSSFGDEISLMGSSLGDESSEVSDEKCNENLSKRTIRSTFGDEISPIKGSSYPLGDELSITGSSFGDESSKGSDDKCNETIYEMTKCNTFGDEISPIMGTSFGDDISPIMGSSFKDESSKRSDDKSNEISGKKPVEFSSDKVLELTSNGKDNSSSNAVLSSEEEEAAFLRSLGWEENGGEDEGLTEEEISSFFKDVDEYIKSRPPSRIIQALNLRIGSIIGSASFGSSSPDIISQS